MTDTKAVVMFHERVDDIPLIIGIARQLDLPRVLDRHLGNHGLHQGLSNGWLAVGWLAYILSEGDHRKYGVQEWANQHANLLERMLGQCIRPVEFADDRLAGLLARLSRPACWQAIEGDLWECSVAAYDIECLRVRLDATTVSGYHTPVPGGLMQRGHSKDHRPDLAQVKLMAAAAEPRGHILGGDVLPGQAADEPLYRPLIARVRAMLRRSGLLYVGDSKMAALQTRAEITANGDYYLMPLPLTGETRKQADTWIGEVVDGQQEATLCCDGERLLGGGYEFERGLTSEVAGKTVEWTERVQVVRSRAFAKDQEQALEKRLAKAAEALWKLTPAPGRGKRQIRTEEALQTAVAGVLEQHEVSGLLSVAWERQEQVTTRYVGRGRGGPDRPTCRQTRVRYAITAVRREDAIIQERRNRMGWRIQATSMPKERMTLSQAVVWYRGGWCLERQFHLLKDRPLGIRPLYVWRDDQSIGLSHLMMLALRVLSLIEMRVRDGLAADGEEVEGVYEGLPNHRTSRPTASRILRLFTRAQVTLTQVAVEEAVQWHLTPLPPMLERVLAHAGLSPVLYTRLAGNSQ